MDKMISTQCLQEIEESVLYILDEKVQNRYYINKHFQNAIMNYFLEDYGSTYLRKHFQMQSNREVRRYLTSQVQKSQIKGTKYIVLMNIYLESHVSLDLVDEYRSLFAEVARLPNPFEIGSQEYISQAWKKAFGLFVLAHSFNNKLDSIFDIWNILFVDQKIFRKRRPNAKTTVSNSEPEEEQTKSIITIKNEAETLTNDSINEIRSTQNSDLSMKSLLSTQGFPVQPAPPQQFLLPQPFGISMLQVQNQQTNQLLLAQQYQAHMIYLHQMEFQRQMCALQQQKQQQQQQQIQAMMNQQFFQQNPVFY